MLQCSDMNPERKYIRRLRDFHNRNLGAFPNIQANRKTLPKKFGRFHKHSSKLKNFTQEIWELSQISRQIEKLYQEIWELSQISRQIEKLYPRNLGDFTNIQANWKTLPKEFVTFNTETIGRIPIMLFLYLLDAPSSNTTVSVDTNSFTFSELAFLILVSLLWMAGLNTTSWLVELLPPSSILIFGGFLEEEIRLIFSWISSILTPLRYQFININIVAPCPVPPPKKKITNAVHKIKISKTCCQKLRTRLTMKLQI